MQATCRAGLNARGFQALAHAIGTERALVNLLGLLVEFGNVEGTAGDAIAAADTVVLLKIDDAVFVFDDRPVCRTGTQATRIFTVHALVFSHQPPQVAVALVFNELNQVPIIPLGRRHRLIRVIEGRFAKRMIVPFDAGNFARFAADARGHVDVLANLFLATRALPGNGAGVGRNFLNLKSSWVRHSIHPAV